MVIFYLPSADTGCTFKGMSMKPRKYGKTVHLTPGLHRRLKSLATRRGMRMQDFVEGLLAQAIANGK